MVGCRDGGGADMGVSGLSSCEQNERRLMCFLLLPVRLGSEHRLSAMPAGPNQHVKQLRRGKLMLSSRDGRRLVASVCSIANRGLSDRRIRLATHQDVVGCRSPTSRTGMDFCGARRRTRRRGSESPPSSWSLPSSVGMSILTPARGMVDLAAKGHG